MRRRCVHYDILCACRAYQRQRDAKTDSKNAAFYAHYHDCLLDAAPSALRANEAGPTAWAGSSLYITSSLQRYHDVSSYIQSIIPGARMSDQDLKAELERLKAENAALKQRGRPGAAFVKVSEKGGVSVYGLGRFPVTLYKEQWEKLLAMADDIKTFIIEHDSELKKKE
jgi:hypothetical protein